MLKVEDFLKLLLALPLPWRAIRYSKLVKYSREEQNSFNYLTVAYILAEHKSTFSAQEIPFVNMILAICTDAIKPFQQFILDANGQPTVSVYNIWPHDKALGYAPGFEGGRYFKHHKFFGLPADLDDTALALKLISADKTHLEAVYTACMQRVQSAKKAPVTHRALRQLKTFPVWLGYKMPLEYDFGVICNVITVFAGKVDSDVLMQDSLILVNEVLETNLFVTEPKAVSVYYNKTPLLAYHAARLAAFAPTSLSARAKNNIKTYCKTALLSQNISNQNRLLISIAYMKIDPSYIALEIDLPVMGIIFNYGGLLTAFNNRFTRWLSTFDFSWLSFGSESIDLALNLEYTLLLRGRL